MREGKKVNNCFLHVYMLINIIPLTSFDESQKFYVKLLLQS
jgi:hypothetical protein